MKWHLRVLGLVMAAYGLVALLLDQSGITEVFGVRIAGPGTAISFLIMGGVVSFIQFVGWRSK